LFSLGSFLTAVDADCCARVANLIPKSPAADTNNHKKIAAGRSLGWIPAEERYDPHNMFATATDGAITNASSLTKNILRVELICLSLGPL
jgi:hypothetical protein